MYEKPISIVEITPDAVAGRRVAAGKHPLTRISTRKKQQPTFAVCILLTHPAGVLWDTRQ